jgi:hypothetical protein
MPGRKRGFGEPERPRWAERDLERGTITVIILMGLVLLAIGIGTLMDIARVASLP